MKTYFCERDIFHNHQYFYGGQTYTEKVVERGALPGEKPQPLSTYLIQITPKVALDPKRKVLLRDALLGAETQVETLTAVGKQQKGAARLIKRLEATIELLTPAVGKAQAATA